MSIEEDIEILRREALRILTRTLGQKTAWVVVSGPPNSGKTTVLRALSALGYRINPDLSRQHLEQLLLNTGLNKYEIRRDQLKLQREILWKMVVNSAKLPSGELIILDYALPDNLVFWQLAGLRLQPYVWKSALLYRYEHVFLFESLPLTDDLVRTEGDPYRDELTTKLRELYHALGYKYIWVPAMPVSDRVKLIERTLHENGSGEGII